ncbi:hypothetical protein CORC01_01255 [Colletotrichum orchidophilum]|uniref:Uncharacterized protein n=1 Tax=Colletotrichum orchidophilum TaxID=1209926 RepID=A0A1G4BQH3_9PEZI|nr:uncharacterized protein CORC01_01255 [Colletotrichum orchidophilum]OHF03536.1 hypothetical protein CORC01_01255 [Colletotrichum orchidophilum]
MATEKLVAVQLKEDWTREKASLAFTFHPSTQMFREVKKNTMAWLHIGQKTDGHHGKEWVTITPLRMTPDGLIDMFPGDHPGVNVPFQILCIALRVNKFWGNGDPAFSRANRIYRTSVFLENTMLMCENLSTPLPDLIVVKRVTFNIREGFTISPTSHMIHRNYVDFGYQKADNYLNNRTSVKRSASQMN